MRSKLSADGRRVFAFPDQEDSCSHLEADFYEASLAYHWGTNRAAKTFDFHCPAL